MTLPRAARQFVKLLPIAFVPGRHILCFCFYYPSTLILPDWMQSWPLEFTVFLAGPYLTSVPAKSTNDRLTIYAAVRRARHFLSCCIKPVTGFIVSPLSGPLRPPSFRVAVALAAVYYAHRPSMATCQ
jgi:hypothetical protein